jgi:ubiquinone/menaquinone biosynthesis C-methylase UbiE
MSLRYDAGRAARFYDEYAGEEWTRFEDGRASRANLEVHLHYLRQFVGQGDTVLDAGAGPGRFTIELARLGAKIVVADLSPRQLELNRERLVESGHEGSVLERVVADVTDLSRFEDARFDAVVCYGGALSYVLERADDAVAELFRVTRPGGHVLASVMVLIGATRLQLPVVLEQVHEHGHEAVRRVFATGELPSELSDGHLPMRLYRWRELRELLGRHPGTVVAASACGVLSPGLELPPDEETQRLLFAWELEAGAEPGALDCGEHLLAVVRKDDA